MGFVLSWGTSLGDIVCQRLSAGFLPFGPLCTKAASSCSSAWYFWLVVAWLLFVHTQPSDCFFAMF